MSVQLGEWRDEDLFIEGLQYQFPKKPKNSEIINYGLPKVRQVWKRITEYKDYNWDEGWEDRLEENPKQLNYLVAEVDRLHNGVWMYINGECVYINRYMYFFCQWYLLEEGYYPQFRDASLYYYRFVEICEKTKSCAGHTLLKARRLGATSMVLSALQLLLITSMNSNYGIVSNKGDNAKKAFSRAVKSMGNLPVFLKPTQEGNTAPKKVLSLKEQAKRITKGTKQASAQGGLNNELSWENTDMNSYDSYALAGLLADEIGKYPTEVPVSKYLQVVIKCLKRGARIVGKLFAPTTVNPPKEGGAEYRVTWDTSNQAESDYLGQTKSGLYRIFVPAYIGFDGYILPYGKSVFETPTKEETELLKLVDGCPDPTIGAKEYLSNIRKQLENDVEALQEEIRMNPFTPQEVFETSNERCLFNIQHLNQRENELVEELNEIGRNGSKDELGRRGWFRKSPSGRVQFVDDDKGLWYIDQLLSYDQSNKWRLDGLGNQTPINESYGACGLDPVFSGQATVDKGSDMCAMIHRRYNSQDEENSDKPVAMFLGRMENEDDMYEQVYNGLIYYGIKMLGERAPIYFVTYAKNHGLSNYLYGTKRSDGVEVKGIVGQANLPMKTEHARVQQMKALDCWYKIPFITLIRNMKEFSITSRTDYDACMAWGFSLLAIEIPLKKVVVKKTDRKFLMKGKITSY